MKRLKFPGLIGLVKKSISEYGVTYEYLTEKKEHLNNRIEKLASGENIREKFKT